MAQRLGLQAVPRATDWLIGRINDSQARTAPTAFVVGVVRKYSDDAASQLAALMTYYTSLSLFPIALVFIAVVSRILDGRPELRDTVIRSVIDDDRLRLTAEQGVANLAATGVLLWVGIVGLLLTGLGGVMAAATALNQIWAVPYRQRFPLPVRYGCAVLALLVIGAGTGVLGYLTGLLTRQGVDRGFILPVMVGVGGVTLTGAALLLTARTIPRRGLVLGGTGGGIVVAGLALLGTEVSALLIARAGPVYGGLASVVGTLALIYVGCQALVVTGEIAAVATWRLWPRSLDSRRPMSGDLAAYGLLARAQERTALMHVEVSWRERPPTESAAAGGDLHSDGESARML